MREVHTQDGKILHMPEEVQRTAQNGWCDCHKTLGNDFWFLPTGSCLRTDKKCNEMPQ